MSLFSLLSVSASGMAAQRTRAELLVENLANAETTRTPEGGPYRRKDVVFESTAVSSPFSSIFSSQLQSVGGVTVSDVITDPSDPVQRYVPGHPDANADGAYSSRRPGGRPSKQSPPKTIWTLTLSLRSFDRSRSLIPTPS